MGENIPCAVETLHRPESGVRQLAANADHVAYAREISRYISCPSTVRARTLEQYGRAPSLELISAMRASHARVRSLFRRSSDQLELQPEDATDYSVKPDRRLRALPPAKLRIAEPNIAAPLKPPALISEIVASIAAAFGLTAEDITGPGRQRQLVLARQTCAYVLWRRGNSYKRIGTILGGRDHSTVIHGCRRFEISATPAMRELAERMIGGAA